MIHDLKASLILHSFTSQVNLSCLAISDGKKECIFGYTIKLLSFVFFAFCQMVACPIASLYVGRCVCERVCPLHFNRCAGVNAASQLPLS